MNRRHRTQRGHAMLEFALATPVLMLLCFGAIDTTRMFRTAMVSASAARAGILYATSSSSAADDSTGIVNAAKQDAENREDRVVTVERYCTCSTGGDAVACTASCGSQSEYVKVTSRVPFRPTVALPGVPSELDMTSISHMRIR